MSAALLVAIAASLGVAVMGLAPYKTDILTSVQSLQFWVVHFPIGLHAGWACAGELCTIVRRNREVIQITLANYA